MVQAEEALAAANARGQELEKMLEMRKRESAAARRQQDQVLARVERECEEKMDKVAREGEAAKAALRESLEQQLALLRQQVPSRPAPPVSRVVVEMVCVRVHVWCGGSGGVGVAVICRLERGAGRRLLRRCRRGAW